MRRDGSPTDLLSRPGPLAIVLCLLHRGNQSRQELEDTVGVQSGTIRYHLDALQAAGLVTTHVLGGLNQSSLVDPEGTTRLLDKARPQWRQGGIPRGVLWREVQAAIDKRRTRKTYRNRL